jgi:hypothetical protein
MMSAYCAELRAIGQASRYRGLPGFTMRTSRYVLLSTSAFALILAACLQPRPATVAKGGEAARVGSSARTASTGAATGVAAGDPAELAPKDLSALIKIKPGAWDQAGAVQLSSAGAIIKLDAVSHKPKLALRYGNAHSYELTLLKDGAQVGQLVLWTKKAVHRAQMIKRRVELPVEAVRAGYDTLRIVPRADPRFSIGGLELLD